MYFLVFRAAEVGGEPTDPRSPLAQVHGHLRGEGQSWGQLGALALSLRYADGPSGGGGAVEELLYAELSGGAQGSQGF